MKRCKSITKIVATPPLGGNVVVEIYYQIIRIREYINLDFKMILKRWCVHCVCYVCYKLYALTITENIKNYCICI